MSITDVRRDTSIHCAILGMTVCSGFSGLVYEIVWFQQLSLILGASAVSLTILLSSFMGGLCLGSLFIPQWVRRQRNPLRVYALLEVLTALAGLTAYYLMPVASRTYQNLLLSNNVDLVARSAVAFLIMLPATFLMGGTLPIIIRRVQSCANRHSWIGWTYAANTFGAVVGSLSAGLFLLRCFDAQFAMTLAATVNGSVAIIALILSRVGPGRISAISSTPDERIDSPSNGLSFPRTDTIEFVPRPGLIYWVIGICGATALGAEVIWTRHLGLVLGPTVYSFSIILSVFLFGTALGSGAGALIVRKVAAPTFALGIVQLLLVGATIYAAYVTIAVVPYFLRLTGNHELFTVRVTRDLIRVAITILPATFLWGVSFPLAARALMQTSDEIGRVVGRLYAVNTLGGILGAAAVSLGGISYGGQTVQRTIALLCFISGWLLLCERLISSPPHASNAKSLLLRTRPRLLQAFALLLLPLCAISAMGFIPATPIGLLAEGPLMDRFHDVAEYRFVAEGLNSPVVVSDTKDGVRCFHVAGKIEASTRERDLRTQRLLGHLPAMSCASPRKALVIGCGSGITAGALLMHPTIEEIVICEIEPTVIQAASTYFATHNYGVLTNPKTKIVYDDARHFLSTTRDDFDIITADPIHPWVKGSASLYTTEFFELCRSRLNEGGIMTLWAPLYESNQAAVKCELATFLQIFPNASIWSGQGDRVGYDLVVVGSNDARPMEPHRALANLESNPPLQFSFAEMGLAHRECLRHRFVAFGEELTPWLRDAEINRDHNLRLQYLAGTNPDYEIAQYILESMHSAKAAKPSEKAAKPSEKSVPVLSVISLEEWSSEM